jgi:3-methyladenine DNA glycosylase AlkD
MNPASRAQQIYLELNKAGTKLGDLRVIAKELKKDHDLAKELWSTGTFFAKLLAILIMDVKKLDADFVDNLIQDFKNHQTDERLQLADWLMANQLTKDKKLIALIQSWQNNPSSIHRRIFWYYQGRLRWMGQTPPGNSEELLSIVEGKMLNEEPEVQWAMNFTTAWIGIFDSHNRSRCIKIGEKLGLYKDEVVAKNCTPNYLPKFIDQEVKKRNL